nr:SAM-dependent methyltransferase [Paenibacillus sambharensis]
MMRWLCTANRGFANYALEELRRLFDVKAVKQIAAGEIFTIETDLEREAMLEAIQAKEPIFLRHIQPVDRTVTIEGNADDLNHLSELVRNAKPVFSGKRTAVHIRRSASSPYHYTASDTKGVLDAVLDELDSEPVMQNPDIILSIYAAGEELLAGWGTPGELLSDWPGGAVRFQREEEQISRAKFKLLEAERAFGLHLEDYKEALDIGAAPGGWTSLLLERGCAVTAVDPADLHPSLMDHPRLAYFKKNAGEVKFRPDTFDLLVCDMSWSPMLMVKLVLDLQASLERGGTAIITIKLMHRKPLQTIRDVIRKLEESSFKLLKAKQLFHNRDEITLYLNKI